MTQSHVLSGLLQKRSELLGRIEDLKHELRKATLDVQAIDSSIKVFDPNFNLRSVRPKQRRAKNRFFTKHGETSRFVLNVLREQTEPLNTNQIADIAVVRKGFKDPDMKALRACIITALSRQRLNGTVIEMGRDLNGAIKWQLNQEN